MSKKNHDTWKKIVIHATFFGFVEEMICYSTLNHEKLTWISLSSCKIPFPSNLYVVEQKIFGSDWCHELLMFMYHEGYQKTHRDQNKKKSNSLSYDQTVCDFLCKKTCFTMVWAPMLNWI